MKIPLSKITPDPDQPRKMFDEKSVEHLAQSMKIEGLIHPIEIDENYKIIVGEMRYRAAKLLGWEEIKANIYKGKIAPYKRLRRQMAENLQQSGSKGGGEPMNPIDVAKAWVRLYELQTGESYQAAEQLGFGSKGTGQVKGVFLTIAEEVGVSKENVWEYLQLLDQPKYVIEDLLAGRPKSYYTEARRAPKEIKTAIKKKIAKGDYTSRAALRADISLAKKEPELQPLILSRKQDKETKGTNKILNGISALSLAMAEMPLTEASEHDKGILANQLNWMKDKIEAYLAS